MSVTIIDTGIANLASVRSAFRALGVESNVISTEQEVTAASYLVLPGVGSFAAGMNRLRDLDLVESIKDHASDQKPLLAVCLGFQLLCEGSEEDPGESGIGIVPGICRKLPPSVRVPQLGWNWVESPEDSTYLRSGMAAFANSFALFDEPDGWSAATTIYGEPFVSAVEKDAIVACQFHPELSSQFGMDILRRWLGLEALEDTRSSTRSETVRIIPCLDVRDGRVVKGIQFQGIRDAGDPANLAGSYADQGADEIIILDIAASPREQETQIETVKGVRACIQIPLTVGGGVRSVNDARKLLNVGADKVSVNSAATKDPSLIEALAEEFGTQCVVCAIDARKNGERWEVLINGGRKATGLNAVTWARQAESLGAGEILLTSWDRDGTRAGADGALLEAVAAAVDIPVIASGGIGSSDDAVVAIESGASAVLAASIFHDGEFEVSDIKTEMAEAGIGVRL